VIFIVTIVKKKKSNEDQLIHINKFLYINKKLKSKLLKKEKKKFIFNFLSENFIFKKKIY
jgi:hypothetical protein